MGDINTADDSSGQGAYAFGPFVVDPLKRRLWRERGLVPISSKTFDVLVVLLEHRDHSVSKDELLNLVWPDTAVNENNLARQISSLRRALGQRPDEHDFVVTIPGHGYRFVATVRELSEVPPELRNGLDGHAHHPPEPALDVEEPPARDELRAGAATVRERADARWSGLAIAPAGPVDVARDTRRGASAPSSRSPWTCSCDSARVRRRLGAACSASPMRTQRCRGRGVGAGRPVGGVRQRPRRQCRPLEAASRRSRSDPPDLVRGQRVAAAVVARRPVHRVPLRARWRRPLRHARERRRRTPRLELRLRAALVAGRCADPVQAFGGAAGSADDVRGGPGWKAPTPRPPRRDRSIPGAPCRLASGRRARLHLGDHDRRERSGS